MPSFFAHNKGRPRDAAREVERTGDKVRELDLEVREVRQELRRVQSAFQALWELTAESAGVTAEQLRDKMAEIDTRADESANLLAPKLVSCPACERKVLSNRQRCVYCGADLHRETDGDTSVSS